MTSYSTRRKLINDEAIPYFANLPPIYRKQLIAIYNEFENRKEVSLPRIAVALNLKYNIPVAGVENYINNRGIEFKQQQIAERESKARNLELLAQAERRKLASIALENELRRMSEKSKRRKEYRKAKRARAVERAKNKKKNLIPVSVQNVPYYLRYDQDSSKIIGNAVYVRVDNMRADIETIREIINIVNDKLIPLIPRGYKFSLLLEGKQYKGDAYVQQGVLFNSNFTNRVASLIPSMEKHGAFDLPSERYWLIEKISLHYELGQGGSAKSYKNHQIGQQYSDYHIFNPKTNSNCGKEILKLYGIEAEKGFLSIAYMKSKLDEINIPIFEYKPNKYFDFDELILLVDNHYIRLIKKSVCVHRRRVIRENMTPEEKKQSKIDKIKRKAKVVANRKVLVYDIESLRNNTDFQIPEVIGYCGCELSFAYVEGSDCVEKFVDMILKGDVYTIIGFNCGKYDFLLIRNEIIRRKCGIKECRSSANGIMKCEVRYTDELGKIKRFTFIDLLNFTNGSLKSNLKAYNCSYSKGEIDYDKIGYDKSPEFHEQLIEYLKADVVGCYELFRKIDEPFLEKGISISDGSVYTLSQIAFKILNKYWVEDDVLQDRVPKAVDIVGRKSAYGGRCEVFKRQFVSDHYDEIKRRIASNEKIDFEYNYMRALDTVSLYPWAMKENYYPTGEAVFTSYYRTDKLGIYKCDVEKPKDILYPVVSDKKHNSYNLIDVQDEYYTSVDIEQMRKYGYKVEIINGYYWTEKHKIFEKYINEYFRIKQNAKKGTPAYNNAKLMVVAPFGKCLQGDDTETYYTCQTKEDLEEMYKGKNQEDFRAVYEEVGGDVVGYYVHVDKKEIGDLTGRKAFVGAFILSYSKQTMYEKMLVSNPYYTDTDSIYCEAKYSEHFDEGKELGQFSDDVDGKIIYALFIAKKLKYIEYIDSEGKLQTSTTGKGCYKGALTRKCFTDMLAGLEVENKNPKRFFRNLKQGSVRVGEYITKIKMNDSNRLWDGNVSFPIIH